MTQKRYRESAAKGLVLGTTIFLCGFPLFGNANAQVPPPPDASVDGRPPRAQNEAMRRFNRAVELYQDGDYAASLIEFKKAYELAPSYKLLYQIGQVYYKLRDYAGAFRAFDQYLAQGSNELTPERRAEVQEELNLLKERTGYIEINTDVVGAQVTIDGDPVGTTPLDSSVLVSVGVRRIAVSADGRQTVTRSVTVAGQEQYSLTFELPLIAAAVDTAVPAATTSRMTVWSWVGIGAAAALGAGATVTGISALGAESSFSEMAYFGSAPDKRIKDQQRKIDNLALTTDILAGAAILTLGTTLVLTFTRDLSPKAESRPTPEKASRGFIQPSIGIGSIGFSGAF